jgi:hypothetical protein
VGCSLLSHIRLANPWLSTAAVNGKDIRDWIKTADEIFERLASYLHRTPRA